MKPKLVWRVSYQVITDESAAHGEYADQGIEYEGTCLAAAIRAFGHDAMAADEWPITGSIRHFYSYDSTDYRTGDETTYVLGIPKSVTPSSRLRLARLLGLKVEQSK